MLNIGEMLKSSSVKSPKWEDLNINILQKIFDGVPFSDLCDNVPFVCQSWRLGCLHTIWPLHSPGGVDESIRLLRLLKTIMEDKDGYECSLEQWRSSIRKIDISENLEISDEHLLYIAERTVSVESLYLWNCSKISGEGFGNALYNWKNVNSLFLEKVRFQYVTQFMEQIVKNYSPFGWLLVWNGESKIRHDDLRGTVKYLSNEVKMMMKLEHCFMSEDGFVIAFSSGSSGEDGRASRDDDELSQTADLLPSSSLFNITMTSRIMIK